MGSDAVNLSESQLNALCSLLEEDQPATLQALDHQIAVLGDDDRERLFERLLQSEGHRISIPPALEEFHRTRLERMFSDWSVSGKEDSQLEEGVFLLASFGYPLDDLSDCVAELDQMAEELRSRLEGVSEPRDIVRHTAYYLHEELGFKGGRSKYYDPENCYLNRVLARREGMPIALSIIYILIGRRLGLSFRGVGMPGHFLLKYEVPDAPIYIDPFDRGKIVSVQDCADIVRGMGYHFDIRFLKETLDLRVVERMLNNLIGIFHREGDEERSRRLVRYREIIQRS
jgi:regulator of sirC expression with transglutaminase-like and TPR domain